MNRRVVVTGLGVVTSLSCKVQDLFDRIADGQSGIHELGLFSTDDFKVKIAGDVYDWNPVEYMSSKEMKRVDRFTQFALVATADAVADAGLDFQNEDPARCGAILGSGVGGIGEIEAQMTRLMNKGPDRVSPMTVPRMMANAAGAMVAISYGIKGVNYCVTTACASATNAMGDATELIRTGAADVIVTGGSEAAITRMALSAFQNIKALSLRNDDPQGASRPFDSGRDGFVFSEGAGVVIFEELEHARRRGARVYCEVLGHGYSTDAGHITQPDEDGAGAATAMAAALKDAQVNPEDVTYINAHGTGTPLGDKAETLAVSKVFGEHASSLSISSTKSQLGHSLGASGGIEMVLTVEAFRRNVIPPTINLTDPDPECYLDYTPNQAREREVRCAMSNSFGFGGHNASVIVGELRNGG